MKKIFIKKEPRIPFTQLGYDEVLAERDKLYAERPEAVEQLRKSRELGDLSENGFYKAARARLSALDASIRRVERLVKLGIVMESMKDGIIDIGSTVVITDGIKEYEYTIVGGYESDPSKKTISHKSPIGKALMGKKQHDSIEVQVPAGTVSYTIQRVIQ